MDLRLRAPGSPLALAALLARALPGREAACRDAVREGRVRVDGVVERAPDRRVPPGAQVEAVLPGALPEEDVADAVRRALDAAPVRAGDAAAALEALRTGSGEGAAALRWRALCEEPAWAGGWLVEDGAADLHFRVEEAREGVATLRVGEAHGPQGRPEALRRRLAHAGFPVLGDTRFGGRLVAGGVRLAPAEIVLPGRVLALPYPAGWWPDEPVFPADGARDPAAALSVSRATLRALERGHPWVLTDAQTGDAARFRPGAQVALRGPRGEAGAWVRIDRDREVVARAWAAPGPAKQVASVEARVARALARRRALLARRDAADGCDAFRLVHGEADDLPGLAVDLLGPCLRVLLTARCCAPVLDRVLDALLSGLGGAPAPDPPVVEVVHLRHAPPGRLEGVRLRRGTLPDGLRSADGRLRVRERGLVFPVALGLAAPTRPQPAIGFFLDQRENRARLAARACGGRWLNLFAHTGAFSAVLLRAGAREVVSVDLSAAWLRWLEETLAENALDVARHRSVRSESRRYLERLSAEERFDGIVLDPPTAASAGRRFWSVRRDLAPLLETALRRLAPGGHLLVCRNDRAGAAGVEAAVRKAATRTGVRLSALEEAGPGPDFPALPGFAEGDPFHGVLARVAGELRKEG